MFTEDDIIFAYTRQEAIEDGVLWDISEQAKCFGFNCSVATTDSIYGKCIVKNAFDDYQVGDVIQANVDELLKTLKSCFQDHAKKQYGKLISLPYEMLAKCVLSNTSVEGKLSAKKVDIKIVLNIELDRSRSITLMLPDED